MKRAIIPMSVSAFLVIAATFWSGAAAWAADMPIAYTVARDGRVSLAVYNQEGRLVRTVRQRHHVPSLGGSGLEEVPERHSPSGRWKLVRRDL